MIAFVVDGEELDLMPNFSIPIEWESGLFSDEFVLNGISTLPVPFPLTDKNKRKLKYFHIVENKLKNLQVECGLILGSNLWCIGTLTVAIKGETFDTDFSEITPFALDADKKLSDLFDENDYYDLIAPYKRWWAFNFYISLSLPVKRLDVYVNGVLHRFDSDPIGSASLAVLVDQIYAQMIADADITNKFVVRRESNPGIFEELIYVEDIEAGFLTQTDNYNIVCPWISATVAYGGTIDWLLYQKNLIKTALDALVDTSFPDSEFCFPIIKNPSFYQDLNPDFASNNMLINNYQEGYLMNSYANKYRYSISPQFFLFAILKKLTAKYGSIVKGSLQEISQIYNRCFVYNNSALDLIGIDGYYTNVSGTGDIFNVFNPRIFIKDHVPNVTLKEFLTTIKNYLCCGLFYRNFELRIDTCQSILKSNDVIDWTDRIFRIYDELKGCFENGYLLKYELDDSDTYLSDKVKELKFPISGRATSVANLPKNVKSGVYYHVIDKNAIYVSKGASLIGNVTQVTWSFYSIYLHDYPFLNAAKDIDGKSSPTINEWHEDATRRINVPHIYQTGTSDEVDLGLNQIPTRLLFFWRTVWGQIRAGGSEEAPVYVNSTDDSVLYPFSTMDNVAPDGSRLGNYSLKFHGDDGLFEKLHKEWLAFKNNAKPFRIPVLLHESELLQLAIYKKIQIGPSQFLIGKIAANITQTDKIIACTVDLYKL